MSPEQISEIAWFLHVDLNSHKLVGMIRNWCGHSGHRTLKLTISRMNRRNELIFVCWCKFRKAKSYFIDFWMGAVKHGHGHLVHETLKSAMNDYELSWFFACWLWCSNSWLDKPRTLYIWLLKTSLLRQYLLDPFQKDPIK